MQKARTRTRLEYNEGRGRSVHGPHEAAAQTPRNLEIGTSSLERGSPQHEFTSSLTDGSKSYIRSFIAHGIAATVNTTV